MEKRIEIAATSHTFARTGLFIPELRLGRMSDICSTNPSISITNLGATSIPSQASFIENDLQASVSGELFDRLRDTLDCATLEKGHLKISFDLAADGFEVLELSINGHSVLGAKAPAESMRLLKDGGVPEPDDASSEAC